MSRMFLFHVLMYSILKVYECKFPVRDFTLAGCIFIQTLPGNVNFIIVKNKDSVVLQFSKFSHKYPFKSDYFCTFRSILISPVLPQVLLDQCETAVSQNTNIHSSLVYKRNVMA
jgi:hypothetical protein